MKTEIEPSTDVRQNLPNLPPFGYQLVAKWRYRLFGKNETCRLPSPKERERFLP
jgi:predicted DCC family thiol-disulfide oxidoreductase YuxK